LVVPSGGEERGEKMQWTTYTHVEKLNRERDGRDKGVNSRGELSDRKTKNGKMTPADGAAPHRMRHG
jgi:hypothetical protein